MAYLPQSTFQRRQSHLQNGTSLGGPSYDMTGDTRVGEESPPEVMPTSQPLQPAATPAPAAQPAPQTQQAPASPLLEAPDPIQQQPSFKQTGTLQERLFQPLQTGAEQGITSLGEAADFFSQEAGTSRSYEGIGAQDTLNRAFTGGAAGDVEAAQGLVGAQYGGPQGLDQGTVSGLQNLLGQMQNRQEALGTGGGLQTLIQQSVGGLTPGQARYEAERRLGDSKVQARDAGFEQTAPLQAQLAQERQEAQDFAKQRTGEEADIAAQSKEFLTGERGKIEGDLASQIQAAQAQQTAESQKYQDVLGADEAGRMDALRAANPELASGFNTEHRQKDIEADRLKQQILDDPKYASIKGIDPLGLTITKRGKQFYSSDGQDLRATVPDKATRALLYERQQEMEKEFDVGTNRAFSKTAGPGEFSTYNPLYGDQGFDAADPAQYLGFDPGTRPSRENLSSAEQKSHFNNIQSIMGNLDNIGESDPFRAAQMFAEIDKYLEDENAAFEAKGENLSAANKTAYSEIKKARKAAKKAKREKTYGQIGAVIGGVLLGGGGIQIGQQIGEGAA
jgi:hypothetical protein